MRTREAVSDADVRGTSLASWPTTMRPESIYELDISDANILKS